MRVKSVVVSGCLAITMALGTPVVAWAKDAVCDTLAAAQKYCGAEKVSFDEAAFTGRLGLKSL